MKVQTIISIIFLIICSYFLFRTYSTIKEVKQKQETQVEMEQQVQAQRYKYLQEMLKQKEIIENHNKYIEEEARNRLGYAMEGETVIYFPEEPISYNESILKELEEPGNQSKILNKDATYLWLEVLFGTW